MATTSYFDKDREPPTGPPTSEGSFSVVSCRDKDRVLVDRVEGQLPLPRPGYRRLKREYKTDQSGTVCHWKVWDEKVE